MIFCLCGLGDLTPDLALCRSQLPSAFSRTNKGCRWRFTSFLLSCSRGSKSDTLIPDMGEYCVEAWVCRAVMESESVLYFSFAIRNRSVYNASRPIGLPKPKPESAVAILYLFVVCLQGTPTANWLVAPIFSCVRSQHWHIVSLMFHTAMLRVVREVDSDS